VTSAADPLPSACDGPSGPPHSADEPVIVKRAPTVNRRRNTKSDHALGAAARLRSGLARSPSTAPTRSVDVRRTDVTFVLRRPRGSNPAHGHPATARRRHELSGPQARLRLARPRRNGWPNI
jgi:hypothetical protein